MEDLLRRFLEAGHGGRPWRAMTRWAWNDRLDPEEVRRQIREMARGGLGGHAMHACRGLDTPYLGPEWMEAVAAAVDEGGHTGVAPWLCDENTSPSGGAGGRVYAGREAFRQKSLVLEEVELPRWEPGETTVAVFVATRDARGNYAAFHRLTEPRAAFARPLRPGEALVHFLYRTGEYVDILNREAADEFLKQTHERYADAVGREFGAAIPGLFTDEPQYGGAGRRVPWSLALPRFFRRACRYELLDHLPELFFPVGRHAKVRFDFYQTVTRLFLLAWSMPIYQGCDRHRLRLAGHLAGEDTLLDQVQAVGAAMPHYEYMHIPGVDHTGRGLGSAVAVKQVASAAAQLGRPRVLGDLFGGAGWSVTFDDLRWVAEWHIALGVNLFCTHASAYSLRGLRKRECPPSLFHHQPWWPQYPLWNDYLARVLSVLTDGTAAADVLVLHPMASAWADYSPLDPGPVEDLDARLRDLVDGLLGIHADFHFGDEMILERLGRVTKAGLEVGAARYRAVVVPDATNLRRSTVRLLAKFREARGKVVFAGRVPDRVDGLPSPEVKRLARRCLRVNAKSAKGRAALRRAVAPALEVRTAAGRDAADILAHWRRLGRRHAFFFLHTNADRPSKVTLRLPAAGTPLLLDPQTGESRRLSSRSRAGRTTVAHTFAPRDSLLLLLTEKGTDAAPPPAPLPGGRMTLKGPWNLRRLDPNVLVLDTARWRTDEGTYGEPMLVMDIQQDLMRRGAQQVVVLRFEFECALDDPKGRRFHLVLEQPAAWEMWLNGMRTPLSDAGPYWDTALRRVDLTPYVRRGGNAIELRRPWLADERRRAWLIGRAPGWETRTVAPPTELEAVYLTGDFAVTFPKGSRQGPRGSRWMRGEPRLAPESGHSTGVGLLKAGYPFFAGRLVMERDVVLKRDPSPEAALVLPAFGAAVATVVVNGEEAGAAWKPPRTVPVGGLLRRGRNRLAVILATGLRNLLGPHHHEEGELDRVAPHAFAGVKGWFGRSTGHRVIPGEYNVVEFGLRGQAVLRY